MKKLIFLFTFCLPIFYFSPVLAQQNQTPKFNGDSDKVLVFAKQMPMFKGNMSQWISDHLTYPPGGAQGTVFLSFVVEKDGSVSNVKVLRGVEHALDSAAMSCVRSMPRWAPGKQDGKLVRVQYTLPIRFQMPEIEPASVNPATPPRVK